MTKFYHAENANRRIGGFIFDLYGMVAGTMCGVYQTSDAAEISTLDGLIANPASAVTSITEAEYDDYVKKKAMPSVGVRSQVVSTPTLSQAAVKGAGASLVENPAPISVETAKEVEPDDVLKTGKIEAQQELSQTIPDNTGPTTTETLEPPAQPEPASSPKKRKSPNQAPPE